MDIFRILEEGRPLNKVESEIFLSLLGNVKDAKKIRRTEGTDFYYVWVNYHKDHSNLCSSSDTEIYHSYYYFHFRHGEWKLRIACYFLSEDPEDIFEFSLSKLPYSASLMLMDIYTENNKLEKDLIFKLDDEDSFRDRKYTHKILSFLRSCHNFESFRKGIKNVNGLDFGLKHDFKAFTVKFMTAPAFPSELLEPSNWRQMKPTHIIQAVCNTCRKVFLACKAQIFERFGPRHWDVDWQLVIRVIIDIYELHQEDCPSSHSVKNLELPHHSGETAFYAIYKKHLAVINESNENKTDENKNHYQSARRVYGFCCLDNGINIQLTEVLDYEICNFE